jgi:hypothetical protein
MLKTQLSVDALDFLDLCDDEARNLIVRGVAFTIRAERFWIDERGEVQSATLTTEQQNRALRAADRHRAVLRQQKRMMERDRMVSADWIHNRWAMRNARA